MRHLDLTVFEPGDMIGTMTADGKVALWTVAPTGGLVSADNRLFGDALTLAADDPLETLDLTTRSYNLLKRNGVHTVGDLVAYYERVGREGLFDIRNMSEKNVDEIIGHVLKLRGRPVVSNEDKELLQ